MNIREMREQDIEAVIELFRANYGDDYAIRNSMTHSGSSAAFIPITSSGSSSKEGGRIVASGAAILDFGDYNRPDRRDREAGGRSGIRGQGAGSSASQCTGGCLG